MDPRVFVFAMALAIGASAAQGGVVITSGALINFAQVAPGQGQSHSLAATAVPLSSANVTQFGSAFSQTAVEHSNVNGQLIFNYDISMARPGNAVWAGTGASLIGFDFTVDVDTPYAISGWLAAQDFSGAGRIELKTSLYDQVLRQSIAYSVQESQHSATEYFEIGTLGGDSYNHQSGAFSGTLIAGHTYRWEFYSLLQAYPDIDGGASAEGNMRLTLGTQSIIDPPPDPPPASVPSPGTLALLAAVGLVGQLPRRAGRRRHPGKRGQ